MERVRRAKTIDAKPCIYGHGTLRYLSNGQCVQCRSEKGAAYYRADPEKYKARTVAWSAANPDAVKRHRKARQPLQREWHKVWASRNRARLVAAEAKRRARKFGASGSVSPDEWQGIVAASFGLCSYCNEHRPLVMDHIDSLSRGGEHSVTNIATVCESCNNSKQATLLLLWMARRGLARAVMCL